MAASITVEQECGTYTGTPYHPHNGYYAGDFSGTPATGPALVPTYGAALARS